MGSSSGLAPAKALVYLGAAVAAVSLAPPASAWAWEPVHEAYTAAVAQAQEEFDESFDGYGPQRASDAAFAQVLPPGSAEPDVLAEAKGRGEVLGAVGAYARVVAARNTTEDPFLQAVDAEAQGSYLVTFRVESDTLAPGTVVPVRMAFDFDGRLDLFDGTGGQWGVNDFYATVYTGAQLIPHEGEWGGYLYEGDATLAPDGFFGIGEWEQGAFAVADDGQGLLSATLDTTKTVTFDGVVGADYDIQFDLVAHAYAAEAAGGSWAVADFYDTGSASFVVADDAGYRITVLPEPGAAGLAALGATGLVATRRRRRRD